ncbi:MULTISPECIES: Clp protease N-terminal domain-containing protein [unclassified Streptomyces]|uniref:Clp protease N-terminal domain-containing protein n=1 Tax=unclassified Streptomyces TaxID=2593676 RepID=UPI0027D7A8B5|nr:MULTISPECIES: Clp protease N-terminal domain-containing protein [unclassified Streptomyces]
MFERFTEDAREVVVGAVAHCARSGERHVDETHLLLALLDREGSRGAFALAALGLPGRREAVVCDLAEARRRGGLTRADADALDGLGIDLTEIVTRVEEIHGRGVLAAAGKNSGSRRSGRRPFARGAKETLAGALRAATARRDRHIGDEHLLLALTARPGVPAEVLADHGVTHESLSRVLYGPAGGEARAS